MTSAVKSLSYQVPFVVAANEAPGATAAEDAPSVTQPSPKSAVYAAQCKVESLAIQAPAGADKAGDPERVIEGRRRKLETLITTLNEQGREFDASVAVSGMDTDEKSDADELGITVAELNAYLRRALVQHSEADLRKDFYPDDDDSAWAERLKDLSKDELAKLKAGHMSYHELENIHGRANDEIFVREYKAEFRPFTPSCDLPESQEPRELGDYESAFTDAKRDSDFTAIKAIMKSNELTRAQSGISPADFEKLVRAANAAAPADTLTEALGEAGEMTPAEKTRYDKGQMSYAEYAFIADRESTDAKYPGVKATPKLKDKNASAD